ncbi:MAG: MFS transporter, partial [Acidimicrobiia bacterium]|nr:MFS transporter [Acidimicrobiia bacterium]
MTSTERSTSPTRPVSPLALALAVTAGAYGSLDSMLNVAFPDLIGDLGIAVVDIQWLVVAFVLASGGTLIGAGRLGDLLG